MYTYIYIYLLIFRSISWPTWESNHLSIMPSQLKKSERSDSVFKTTLKKVSNRWKTSWIMQIWDKHCFLVLSSICSDKFSVVWYQCWKDPARNLVVLKLEGTLIIYSPSFLVSFLENQSVKKNVALIFICYLLTLQQAWYIVSRKKREVLTLMNNAKMNPLSIDAE